MVVPLRLALWNANGLSSQRLNLETFLDIHKIDIALVSETPFTSRTVFRLPRYTVFHTTHTDDTAHGGAAVVIRSSLRHHEHLRLQTAELQAIADHLDALPWPLKVSASTVLNGLKAEVFMVAEGATDYNRRTSMCGIVWVGCLENSVAGKPKDCTGRKVRF
jgi:hypothetical protein